MKWGGALTKQETVSGEVDADKPFQANKRVRTEKTPCRNKRSKTTRPVSGGQSRLPNKKETTRRIDLGKREDRNSTSTGKGV